MTKRSIAAKKKRGIYYTPIKATQLLCEWAIRLPHDRVLEPSFGGCSFLQSSKERLTSIECRTPNKQLYGCDIDKQAFNHLSEKIGPVDVSGRFLLADFLSLVLADFGKDQFDVVIGNPPYVATRDMYKRQKKTALRIARANTIPLRGVGSLWAYFLVHSLSFLRKDGRMAWVLPNSLIQTYYGTAVSILVAERFKKVTIIPLTQKLFSEEGTKESSVVLLADGFRQRTARGNITLSGVNSLEEFARLIRGDDVAELTSWSTNTNNSGTARLTRAAQAAYRNVFVRTTAKILNSVASVRIGLVTGNNRFFLLDPETVKQKGLRRSDFRTIFAKFGMTERLEVTASDLQAALKNNRRCMLLNTKRKDRPGSKLTKYLSGYLKREREKVLTFGKRKIWHLPDDGRDPDAFFSYMCHVVPRLVLNTAGTTCTNSIHRVYFRNKTPLYEKKLIAISLMTTFSNLSAELFGRRYGSGLLKLEPSEVGKLPCVIPVSIDSKTITRTFELINGLLRNGRLEEAQAEADALVFGRYISEFGTDDLTILRTELHRVRNERLHRG